MPAPEPPAPHRDVADPALSATRGGTPAAAPAAPPASPAPAVTVDVVRRVHVSEDWLATAVGLAIVALGLLGLIPEGLVP